MPRCRFVQPDVVRLHLVDVHKRALQRLEDELKTIKPKDKKAIEAVKAAIAERTAAVAEAQADGAWIDVKKELTAGEQRGVYGRLVKELHFGEKASLIPEQVGLSKIIAYLVGWSFTDQDGKPVPFSEDAVNNLDGPTYAEIVQAIDDHEEQIDAARAARKNGQGTSSTSEATLTSLAE